MNTNEGFKRRFSRGQLASACVMAVFIACAPVGAQDTRPNILWLVAEDMSPDMGCYNDAYAQTPNLDRFRAQGALFTRAFSISGVCAPSRSAIITGMYPTTIGTHHMRSAGVPPPYVKCFTEYLRAEGYYCTNNAKTDYNFGHGSTRTVQTGISTPPLGAWDENGRRAHWRGREDGQPFFSVFNFGVTHESRIRLPDDRFAKSTEALGPLGAPNRHDPAKAKLPPYYPDTPEVRQDWARYHDLITTMDMQVEKLLQELEEDGLAENTLVFFYGDHGRGLPRAKRWVYDSGIQIPLLIRWPGKIAPGSVREDLVSFIDFAPTLLSVAGADIPEHLQGRAFLGDKAGREPTYIFAARDRMDETYDIIRAVRDRRYKYIRNFEPEKPYAQPIAYMDEMPTMKVWRRLAAEGKLASPAALFLASAKPIEELYDLNTDPHEIDNLAGMPKYRERLEKMRTALETWMDETNDLAFVPEPELLERMRPGGEWQVTGVPALSVEGGVAEDPLLVTINPKSEYDTLVYQLGDDESGVWKLYRAPFEIRAGTAVRAKAGRIGYVDSDSVEAAY